MRVGVGDGEVRFHDFYIRASKVISQVELAIRLRFCYIISMTNLAKLITAYQQKFDVSGKDLAKQIGVNASTIARIKQGKMPDADGFAKIILWMTK